MLAMPASSSQAGNGHSNIKLVPGNSRRLSHTYSESEKEEQSERVSTQAPVKVAWHRLSLCLGLFHVSIAVSGSPVRLSVRFFFSCSSSSVKQKSRKCPSWRFVRLLM